MRQVIGGHPQVFTGVIRNRGCWAVLFLVPALWQIWATSLCILASVHGRGLSSMYAPHTVCGSEVQDTGHRVAPCVTAGWRCVCTDVKVCSLWLIGCSLFAFLLLWPLRRCSRSCGSRCSRSSCSPRRRRGRRTTWSGRRTWRPPTASSWTRAGRSAWLPWRSAAGARCTGTSGVYNSRCAVAGGPTRWPAF